MTTTAATTAMQVTRQQVGPYDLRVWQAGEGPGLLWLHGLEHHPGDAPFLRSLAGSRDVRAPELPGYGESTGAEHLHDVQDAALMLRALVDSWGLSSVDVVGHSLGGMLAAELAIVAPHLVRRLVLVDSYGLWQEDFPLVDPFVLTPPALAAAKWHDPSAAPDPEPSALEDDSTLGRAVFRSRNMGTATRFLWPLPDRGLRRRLSYLTVPTLVVHGESDGLVPLRYAEELARLLPHGRLAPIPTAGHLPMLEAPEAFERAVLPFLQD